MPAGLFSHNRAETATEPYFSLKPTHASPLPLQRRGVRRAKALFCHTAPASLWSRSPERMASIGLVAYSG